MFGYRKYHSCPTAPLALTEQWKENLDNHNIIGTIAIDLSKAFDCLPVIERLQLKERCNALLWQQELLDALNDIETATLKVRISEASIDNETFQAKREKVFSAPLLKSL